MTNTENQDMYRRYLASKEMLKKIPGVIDVGLGLKEIEGKFSEDISYVVYVREKVNEMQLLPEHIIPKEMNGIKTDVVKIATSVRHIRPIRGGVKIEADDSDGIGTMGCMATHPVHGRVFLTNHHILYNQIFDNVPSPVKRDIKVGQPNISCSWCCKSHIVGVVKDSLSRNGGTVDCGIVKVDADISSVDELNGGIPIKGTAQNRLDPNGSGVMCTVFPNDIVQKVGADTNHTWGKVTRVGIPHEIHEEDGSITTVNDQIEIIHKDGDHLRFDNLGDSGAVVLDTNNLVVGLIFAGAPEAADPPIHTYANNISNVISAMDITINKTPVTSGGSSSFGRNIKSKPALESLDEEDSSYQVVIKKYRKMLEESDEGREVLKRIKMHAPEVRNLVYHNRLVTVTWQRNQGPAFIATIIKNLRNENEEIIHEVNGITTRAMLENMAAVLMRTGSDPLRNDVQKYAERILPFISHCETYKDLIQQAIKINNHVMP